MRKIIARLALVLAVCVPTWTARGANGTDGRGEGDWPLFCSISDNAAYDAFLLRAEQRSPSGYTLYFYANGRAQSAVYPDVQETEDGQFLQVYGVEAFGLFNGHNRHLLAYLAKTSARTSEAAMKTTRRNVNPEFSTDDFQPSNCSPSN